MTYSSWRQYPRMGPVEQLAATKELQRRSVLPFSASSGEGAQDSQAKPRPRILAVLLFLALISCCAEFFAVWTAATSCAGQSCSAQEDEGLLRRRANQAMAGHSDLGASTATLPREVHSSADRGRQKNTQVCEKIKAAVRVTISHLQLQRVSSLSFSAGSGKRSLSLLLKLVQTSWICRDTGQHCVLFSFSFCAQRFRFPCRISSFPRVPSSFQAHSDECRDSSEPDPLGMRAEHWYDFGEQVETATSLYKLFPRCNCCSPAPRFAVPQIWRSHTSRQPHRRPQITPHDVFSPQAGPQVSHGGHEGIGGQMCWFSSIRCGAPWWCPHHDQDHSVSSSLPLT